MYTLFGGTFFLPFPSFSRLESVLAVLVDVRTVLFLKRNPHIGYANGCYLNVVLILESINKNLIENIFL